MGDYAGEGFLEPFDRAASENPERVLAWGAAGSRPMTLGQAQQASMVMSFALRERGVVPGDRVAVMAANGLVPLIIGYAIARAGAVWLALDRQHGDETIAWQLGLAEPVLAIADSGGADRLRALGPARSTEVLSIPDVDDVPGFLHVLGLRSGSGSETVCTPPPPTTPLLLIGTSGTTGRPKLAVVTHHMLRVAGQGVVECAGLRAGDVLYVWEPMSHIGGAQLLAAAALCEVGLWITDGFDPGRFWEQARSARASHIHYLGGILHLLAAQPPGEYDRTHGVRIGWGAGASPELAELFHRRFGIALHECYGLTEAASISTYSGASFDGSLGRPAPWAAITITGPDGSEVAAGASGEIVISEVGPPYFAGYFADPQATAAVFLADGLHTGDRGRIDATGRLYYEGRLGDVFRCRGRNVSAWEVEQIAATHPDVGECALTAVPGEFGDEDLVLTLTTAPGHVVELPHFISWLRGRLGAAALPRYYRLVADFPRTASHRIIKAHLPDTVADCHDRFADLTADEGSGGLEQVGERAWRRVLGPDPGRWPSFTAAGGDSTAWVKMVLLVQEATGRRVPQDRCHPEMGLTEFLDALVNDAHDNELGGDTDDDRPVVVFLPAAGGDGPRAADFRRNGEREFRWLTLNYPGWQEIVAAGLDPDDVVDALADEIARAGLPEPLHLAGYSSGAGFAYALAHRMRRDGRELAPVLIIDSAVILRRDPVARPPLVRRVASRLLAEFQSPATARPDSPLIKQITAHIQSSLHAVIYAHRRSRTVRRIASARLPPTLGSHLVTQYFHTEFAATAAHTAASNEQVDPIPLALVRSSSSAWKWLPDDLGWGSVARITRLDRVEADHMNVVLGAPGARVREILRELCNQSLPGRGPEHDH